MSIIKENIQRLYKVFDYPRVNKAEKELARKDIINELGCYGYKTNVSINKDHRWYYRWLRGGFSSDNYNISTECKKPEYVIVAHYDAPKSTSSPYYTYFERKCGASGLNKTIPILKILFIYITIVIMLYLMALGIFAEAVFELGVIKNIKVEFVLQISKIMAAISFISLMLYLINGFRRNSVYAADDNTSGVVAALTLAKELKEQGISNVKFIFCDNEEQGLCGSYSYLKENELPKNIKVINLDTVGRGRRICLSYKRNNPVVQEFKNHLEKMDVGYIERSTSFSDDISFTNKGYAAITIVRSDILKVKNQNKTNIYWVHTKDDTIENIDYGRMEEVVSVVSTYIKESHFVEGVKESVVV